MTQGGFVYYWGLKNTHVHTYSHTHARTHSHTHRWDVSARTYSSAHPHLPLQAPTHTHTHKSTHRWDVNADPIVDVSASDWYTCAVTQTGFVYYWGLKNTQYRHTHTHAHVHAPPHGHRRTPTQSLAHAPRWDVSADPIVDVSASDWYTCAVTQTGFVYYWGLKKATKPPAHIRSHRDTRSSSPPPGGKKVCV